jgi:CubicO group peptidase (beta-lactamase class C family)
VSPGFEAVAEEFERNFVERGEVGAAVVVYRGEKPLLDLWGGFRDPLTETPWEEDSLILVFSTSKGLAAMPLALLHSRGLFDWDDLVARYWPEFAQAGKQDITIRQLLCHQAGLCALDHVFAPEDLADLNHLAEVLARQKPAWKPGTRQGYHGVTLGFYEGELVRRLDAQGRSLGQFFQQEVASPLGVEFYFGLPPEVNRNRVARLLDYHPARLLLHLDTLPWRFALAILNPFSLTYRTLRNPHITRPGDYALEAYQAVEVPAANGIGQTRAMARAYSCLATGGQELGLRPETLLAFEELSPQPSEGNDDLVLHQKALFSLGFAKPRDRLTWGTSPRAYGSFGAGGSFGFADPETGIGYAYAMNKMGYSTWDDPRERALRWALQDCLHNE